MVSMGAWMRISSRVMTGAAVLISIDLLTTGRADYRLDERRNPGVPMSFAARGGPNCRPNKKED